MKKGIVILAVVLVFALLASGCAKRIGDKIAENIVEDQTGADVDISNDGKDVTIQTEEGDINIAVGDSVEWPGDKMADLPQPKATITGVVDNGDIGCSVAYTEMKEEDAEAYMQALKDLGYTENVMDMSGEDSIWFTGMSTGGATATVMYTMESKDGMISYTPPQPEE